MKQENSKDFDEDEKAGTSEMQQDRAVVSNPEISRGMSTSIADFSIPRSDGDSKRS